MYSHLFFLFTRNKFIVNAILTRLYPIYLTQKIAINVKIIYLCFFPLFCFVFVFFFPLLQNILFFYIFMASACYSKRPIVA